VKCCTFVVKGWCSAISATRRATSGECRSFEAVLYPTPASIPPGRLAAGTRKHAYFRNSLGDTQHVAKGCPNVAGARIRAF
jgi:hypothetical protein